MNIKHLQLVALVLLIIVSVFLLGADISFAENGESEGFVLLQEIDGYITGDPTEDIGSYLNDLFRLGIALATGFAVLLMVIGGVTYMVTGSVQKKGEGRAMIGRALFGLIIALAAFAILQTINPEITELRFIDRLDKASDLDIDFGEPGDGAVNGEATDPDGSFSYRNDEGGNIALQRAHASNPLNSLLSCMSQIVPGNAGEISSISDNLIVTKERTWEECASGLCQHQEDSCHYGGTSCIGESYAVDFGDEQNANTLAAAADSCSGGQANIINEGDHLHVSIGGASGCGCN